MSDDRMRAVYQELVASRTPTDRSQCPDIDVLSGVAEGTANESRRLEVLDHVMQCIACRREFEQLRATVAARPAQPRVRTYQFALAASLLIVVAGGTYVLRARTRTNETFRSTDGGVALVAPTGQLAASATRALVWRPVAGAQSYRVEVLDTNDAVRFSATLSDTAITLPDSVALTPGASYDWWVRAQLADGREARSLFMRFQPR